MNKSAEILLIAFSVMCIGVLVYILDRQSEYIYFLPAWLSLNNIYDGVFGNIGYFLPTFIHVYVFILFTAVVSIPTNRKLIQICVFWFLVDSFFEIGQIGLLAELIANHVPAWFSGVPILNNTADYFLTGTFDVLDLASIAMGAITAYLTIMFVRGRV